MAPLLQRLRNAIWLRDAERAARTYPPLQREKALALYRSAQRRTRAAELAEEEQVGAGLALQREAAALFIVALLVARGRRDDAGDLDGPRAWAELAALLADGASTPPEQLDLARSLLCDPDPLVVEKLAQDAQADALAAIDEVLRWLELALEPRTLAQIKRERGLRVSATLAALIALLAILSAKVLARPNLALGKPVVASSRFRIAPAPLGLVDGRIGGGFGAHTDVEDSPWIMVDLLTPTPVQEIKLFNRDDGYFDEGLPFVLEASLDGHEFSELGRRNKSFSALRPWRLRVIPVSVRYIRVRAPHHGYIALSELEAYGP